MIDNDIPSVKSGRAQNIVSEGRNETTHFQQAGHRSKIASSSTPPASSENTQIVDILTAKAKRKEADHLKTVPPQNQEFADEISSDDETFRASK